MRLAAMVRDTARTWNRARRHQPGEGACLERSGERQEHLARLLADHHGFSAAATSAVPSGSAHSDPETTSREPLIPGESGVGPPAPRADS